MKKIIMAVASVAVAVVLTGCGGSPSTVAEKFADAVIQRETDKAVSCYCTIEMNEKTIKALKEEVIEKAGKEINDNKLESEAIYEKVQVPPEDSGYELINGVKSTGERARVIIQFVKGKDKKSEGMEVKLRKYDGNWLVTNFDMKKGLDTSSK